jgi:hypothetical protein
VNRLFPEAPQPIYCCDADALIQIERANLLNQLCKLAILGQWKISDRVYVELHRHGTDRLSRRLPDWRKKYDIVVDLNLQPSALAYLPGIERAYGPEFHIGGITYPGFWRSASQGKRMDSYKQRSIGSWSLPS